jgi:hypothetical protein
MLLAAVIFVSAMIPSVRRPNRERIVPLKP